MTIVQIAQEITGNNGNNLLTTKTFWVGAIQCAVGVGLGFAGQPELGALFITNGLATICQRHALTKASAKT